jgi:hypothetical protein
VHDQRGRPLAQGLQAAPRKPAYEREFRLPGVEVLVEFHDDSAPERGGLPRQQQVPGDDRDGPPLEDQDVRSLCAEK